MLLGSLLRWRHPLWFALIGRGADAGPGLLITLTYGSCIGNPGPGGWASVLRGGDREKELVGRHPETHFQPHGVNSSNRRSARIESGMSRPPGDRFAIRQEGNHRAPAQVALKWLAEV
jgi:hypothetical protein